MKTIRISFIGAGKVGFSFGKYLKGHGIEIAGFFSRNHESSKEAAAFVSSGVFLDYPSLVQSSDMIFITTPDSAVKSIYEELTKFELRGKIIAHMSGSLAVNIFEKSNLIGVNTISVHPICPISDKYQSFKNLESCCFSLEGDDLAYEKVMQNLFFRLPNKTFRLTGENKALYHLANVMVSNLYIALLSKAAQYLSGCGISESDAMKALFPLIEANIRNVLDKGITGALTGPVERNDVITIQSHLSAMPAADESLYKELSRVLVSIAKEKHEQWDYSVLEKMLN